MKKKESPKTGLKYDSEKTAWHLTPFHVFEQVAEIFTFGAKKYAPDNWKDLEDPERLLAAMMRHISSTKIRGELFDKESGKLHLDHAITSLIMYRELKVKEYRDALDEIERIRKKFNII